jgi:hypothetical protein
MSVEATKNKVIAQLVEARSQILDAASGLSADQQDEVFLGVWAIKDLLAHLIGWDFANIQGVQAILKAEMPGFYAHYDRDWQTFNARLVAQYKQDDLGDMLAATANSHQQLIDLLHTVPADEFDNDRGLRAGKYKVTIARILQAEARDELRHSRQIQEFAQRSDPASGS